MPTDDLLFPYDWTPIQQAHHFAEVTETEDYPAKDDEMLAELSAIRVLIDARKRTRTDEQPWLR